MPIATSPSVPRPATFAKMEDRKRPASTAVDDNAPPSKRQAVNGVSKPKDDADKDKEELWIEVSPDCRASRPSLRQPSARVTFPFPPSHGLSSSSASLNSAITGLRRAVLDAGPRPSVNISSCFCRGARLDLVANARLAGNSQPEDQAGVSLPCLDAPPHHLPRRYLPAALYTRHFLGCWDGNKTDSDRLV